MLIILPGSVATDVARNAITGDGGRRGLSDAVIDAGDDPWTVLTLSLRRCATTNRNSSLQMIWSWGLHKCGARIRTQ